jgi:hypothetical protein
MIGALFWKPLSKNLIKKFLLEGLISKMDALRVKKYLDYALICLAILLTLATTLGIFPYTPEAALLIIIIVWVKELAPRD